MTYTHTHSLYRPPVCCCAVSCALPPLSMDEIYVRHVELLGFEKRYFPSQHYVRQKTFHPLVTENNKWILVLTVVIELRFWTLSTVHLCWCSVCAFAGVHADGEMERPRWEANLQDLSWNTHFPRECLNIAKYKLCWLNPNPLWFVVTEIAEGDVSHWGWSNRKKGQNHPVTSW